MKYSELFFLLGVCGHVTFSTMEDMHEYSLVVCGHVTFLTTEDMDESST